MMNSPDKASHGSFAGDDNGKTDLVLCACTGYPFADVRPFVLSLRASGYTGDLVVLCRRENSWPQDMIDEYRITLQFYEDRYPYMPWISDRCSLLPSRLPCEPTFYITRHVLQYLYLQEHGDRYSRVMLADVRDIFFQRDPFDFSWDSDLCCFLEEETVTILESRHNTRWVTSVVGEQGLREIDHKIVSCAGVVTGTTAGVQRYSSQMVAMIMTAFSDPNVQSDTFVDQGIHNYLLHTGRLGCVRLLTNETGPVLTLGYTPKGSVKRDNRGLFLTEGGDVANVLHQYDRHADILNVVLKKYCSIFYRLKRLAESVSSYSGDPRKMVGAVGVFLRFNAPGLYAALGRTRLVRRGGRSTE